MRFPCNLLACALIVVAAAPAFADTATFTLATPNPSATPGATVQFDGTLRASGANAGPVYLLGASFTKAAQLTLDDRAFFLDTPLSLSPGQMYQGPLFTLTLPATLLPGVYDGSFQITLSDASYHQFTVDQKFAVSAVATPEPQGILLVGTGALGIAGVLRRRFCI